jgi:uncharacterized protein
MIPTFEEIQKLHQKYASFATAPNLDEQVFEHCQVVSEVALWCADNTDDSVDRELLQAAALLHDIGTYPFLALTAKRTGRDFIRSMRCLAPKSC